MVGVDRKMAALVPETRNQRPRTTSLPIMARTGKAIAGEGAHHEIQPISLIQSRLSRIVTVPTAAMIEKADMADALDEHGHGHRAGDEAHRPPGADQPSASSRGRLRTAHAEQQTRRPPPNSNSAEPMEERIDLDDRRHHRSKPSYCTKSYARGANSG